MGICFMVPSEGKGGIFGFAEFVQAFALLILIYTMSDVRYRFRAATAPVPLWSITFWVSGTIGLGTLFSDLWFAKSYPLPWFLVSQAYWQLSFGLLFLAVVMLWLWYAFVSPPIYGRWGANNFARQVYFSVLQGTDADLPIIASELGRSAANLVKYAPLNLGPRAPDEPRSVPKRSTVQQRASDILLIIGSRKFCRHIAASAPVTAMRLFNAMSEQEKYRLPVNTFASNLTSEALINKDSALYHEDEGYYSGYFGYTRPFTNAIFGDHRLVEALSDGNSPLDIDLDVRFKLDAEQLEAYCRAVLTTYESAMKNDGFYSHYYSIHRAFSIIEGATSDLYRLNEKLDPADKEDLYGRIRAATAFFNSAIKILDEIGVKPTTLRRHDKFGFRRDPYDNLAELAYNIILHAAWVDGGKSDFWTLQYSYVWSELFKWHDSPVRRIVLFKLRRLLYDEISSEFTNYQTVSLLSYLLKVGGVKLGPKKNYQSRTFPLSKAVIAWTEERFWTATKDMPDVARRIERAGLTFDQAGRRLIKTYAKGLSKEAPYDVLLLKPRPRMRRKQQSLTTEKPQG